MAEFLFSVRAIVVAAVLTAAWAGPAGAEATSEDGALSYRLDNGLEVVPVESGGRGQGREKEAI